MQYQYTTSGVCSSRINIDVEDNIIRKITFEGGCNGNLKGIGRLIEGMKPEDVIERLSGIRCGMRSTSCGDQLAKALIAILANS